MGEAQVCSRSLGATLVAAVSSFVLFATANRKHFFLLGSKHVAYRVKLPQLVLQVFHLLGDTFQPWIPFLTCVHDVLLVRAMRTRLRSKGMTVDRHTVAIITLCPILIEIPNSHDEPPDDPFDIISDLEDVCPSELLPKSSAEDVRFTASPRFRKFVRLRQPDPDGYNFEQKYRPRDLAQREALLVAGLEPEYAQLSYLRARSTFESRITALQAAGYMLSLTQRLMQHLDISPLELLVAFYSLLTMSQLVMESYACGHYQRPLLLRLTPSQFSQYREFASDPPFYDMPRRVKVSWMAGQLLALLLVCVPAVWYYYRYFDSCPRCSGVSALFLNGTGLSILPLLSLIFVPRFRSDIHHASLYLRLSSIICFHATWVIAVWTTVEYWDLFKVASTGDWFARALFHVFS